MSRPSVWIVIPAFREAASIAGVVADLKALRHNVVVVDDGSFDATAQLAEQAGAIVLRHAVNLGQGAALQTGIEFALSRGAQWIVTFDADGQHDPQDIAALLGALRTGAADFALGSRFLDDRSTVPPLRRMVLRAATLFTMVTSRMALTDAHNGLRAMTARGARAIHLRQNRMAHASEIVNQIAKSGLAFVEVPVHVRYSAYSLAKGQRSIGALRILADLLGQGVLR